MAINLGEINFGLGPDTTRLERARRTVVQFGQAVNQAARDQGEGARATEVAMRRQEKAIVSSLNQILKLNDALRKAGANPAQLNSTTATFNRLVRELTNGRVSALQFQRSMEDVQTGIGRVNRALNQHNAEQARLARANREAARAAQEQTNYTLKQERALFSATEAVNKYHAALARTRNAPAALGSNATSALNQYRGSMGAGMDAVAMQRASQQFQAAMNRNVEALNKFKAAQHGASDNRLANTLDRLANVSVLLNGPLGGVAARLSVISSVADKVSVSTAAMVVGIAGAGYAFTQLGKSAIAASKIFERAEQSLGSLNELFSLTGVQIDYIMDVADRAGGSFGLMSQQFAKLQAASEGTNLEGQRTIEIFELISLAGAKMSLTQDEIAGSLRAVEQIMSKGTVQAEELRGQLGDRIPGAVQIMARALGITTDKLSDLMKQGKITSDALVPFVQELARTYGVDLGDAIETVVSSEGRLFNALLRANKAADDAIGFSKAYQNTLGTLTGLLNYAAENMDTLVKVTVTAGAAFAGLYAPVLLGGLMSLVGLIRSATVAMVGLNAATMANPLGALATVLTRVTLAVGAAVGAWALLDSWMDTKKVDDMSAALEGNRIALANSGYASAGFRSELEMQIRMQRMAAQAAWDEALAQTTAAKAKGDALRQKRSGGLFDVFPQIGAAFTEFDTGENALNAELDSIDTYIRSLDEQLQFIENMRKELGEGVGPLNPLGGAGDGSDSSANRIAKALRDAKQAIIELDDQYQVFQLPEGMREWANTQAEVNDKVQDFKDKLVDAKVPAGQIVTLTDQYAQALLRMEEAAYAAEHSISVWQALGDVIGGGLDDAMTSFLDSVIEGKDILLELKDVGKAVAIDLLKSFTQLAVMNPLKNALFGQNNQTMNWGGGGGGIGGFLSSLFGGMFGGGGGLGGWGTTHGAGFGGPPIMSARGNAFRGGGLLTQPTMFGAGGKTAFGGELDDEAILPLGRTSSGNLGVMAAGGGSGGTSAAPMYNNFYLSANGDEAVMSIVEEAVAAAFEQYNAGFTQRTAQANVKAKFRRMNGSK